MTDNIKYRVTAYENNGDGPTKIVKREVVVQTIDPQTQRVLGSKQTKQQVREVVENAPAAAELVREHLEAGYRVQVEAGSGRKLDEVEFTDLARVLLSPDRPALSGT